MLIVCVSLARKGASTETVAGLLFEMHSVSFNFELLHGSGKVGFKKLVDLSVRGEFNAFECLSV